MTTNGRDCGDAASDSSTQSRLDRYTSPQQCAAISIRTPKRCEHDALPGIPYCADHYHLFDDTTACPSISPTPLDRGHFW